MAGHAYEVPTFDISSSQSEREVPAVGLQHVTLSQDLLGVMENEAFGDFQGVAGLEESPLSERAPKRPFSPASSSRGPAPSSASTQAHVDYNTEIPFQKVPPCPTPAPRPLP